MIGFSTGCLYKNFNPVSKEAIEIVRSTGCRCIELCVGKVERMSLHLPDDVKYSNNEETKNLFDKIIDLHKRICFDSVVLHPDLVLYWDYICNIDLPLAFENMDNRKDFGKSVEDMQKVFSRRNFGFVLDLMHAFTNDSSMKLSKEFYNNFKNKICHLHLSGYFIQEDGQSHSPLFQTKQKNILLSVPLGKPVVIESVFSNCINKDKVKFMKECLDKELNYVRNLL